MGDEGKGQCVKTQRGFGTVLRDTVLFLLGATMIGYQQITNKSDVALLMVALALILGPGAIGLLFLRWAGRPGTTPTAESSSSSHSSHPPSPSS